MQRGYTTIDEVVNDFQLMIDDTSYDKDAQIYQLRLLALQGLRELTFDVEQVVSTTDITVGNTLKNTLPSNFVKINRIGFLNSDDMFVPISRNSDLNIHNTSNAKINYDSYDDENNPYYHTDLGRKYGVGGGQNTLGYYRLNRGDNFIHFSSNLSGKKILMEYISDGIGETTSLDHVIKLNFRKSFNNIQGGIKENTIIAIPSGFSPSAAETFIFKTETSYDEDNDNHILLSSNSNGSITSSQEDIAIAFCNTLNKFNSLVTNSQGRMHAVPSGNGAVNITYSPVDYYGFVPPRLDRITFSRGAYSGRVNIKKFNTAYHEEGQLAGTKPLDSMSVIQQGVSGTTPKVHNFCEEALRCYIYYKYIQRKRGVPANEKQMAKRAYYNEKRLARARMMNFGKEEALRTSRKAFKQSPKI